jgi:glucan biosynthesis protein C
MRRYDVDWLRVGALGLLIVYHVVISFQPWAFTIFFIQNKESMEGLWPFMSMVNVWRIPILFLVSGMGVRFAMERRNWKQLLKDRATRILLPLVFGTFFICPISALFALDHYGQELEYLPNVGHLWFLGNIFLYVLLLLPLFVYLRKNPDGSFFRFVSRLLRRPFAIALAAVPLMAETWIVDPQIFVLYANTAHGFWLGMLCFLTGFIFVSLGAVFWQAAERVRHLSLALAFTLYLGRIGLFGAAGEINVLLAVESMAWMIALLGYGSRHLDKPSRALAYCSKAVYPVYIVHMPVQFSLSYLVIPLALSPPVKLLLILAGTLAVSLAVYELLIKRARWIRPLFEMKPSLQFTLAGSPRRHPAS